MHALLPFDITDATLVSSTAAEADYAAWVSGITYAVGDRRIRTTTHSIYERLTAGAGTTAPEDDELNWLRVGPTNRWAMFDLDPASRTSVTSPLTVVITVTGTWADIVLLGVTGTTVTVTATGVSKTQAVPAEVVAGKGSTVVLGSMAGVAGNVTISITGTGTVACAQMAIGTWTYCGDTARGAQITGADYSTMDWDTWGNLTRVTRGQARKLSTPVSVPVASFDQVARVLTALRAEPCMWRGLSWVSSSVVWGVLKSWSLKRDGRQPHATGTVEVLGTAIGV